METNELLEVLRERLHVSVVSDTYWDWGGTYARYSVTLEFIDDDGERHTISEGSDSICIDREDN